MSGVLFNSLYDSELPNAKGCAQWKIELQLFGQGGSVIVSTVYCRGERVWPNCPWPCFEHTNRQYVFSLSLVAQTPCRLYENHTTRSGLQCYGLQIFNFYLYRSNTAEHSQSILLLSLEYHFTCHSHLPVHQQYIIIVPCIPPESSICEFGSLCIGKCHWSNLT